MTGCADSEPSRSRAKRGGSTQRGPSPPAKHLPPVTPLEKFNGTVLKRCVLVPLLMPLSSRAAGLCGSVLAFRSRGEVGVRCDFPPRSLALLAAEREGIELFLAGDEPQPAVARAPVNRPVDNDGASLDRPA